MFHEVPLADKNTNQTGQFGSPALPRRASNTVFPNLANADPAISTCNYVKDCVPMGCSTPVHKRGENSKAQFVDVSDIAQAG